MEFGTFADVDLTKKKCRRVRFVSLTAGEGRTCVRSSRHISVNTFAYKSDLINYRGCVPDSSREIKRFSRVCRWIRRTLVSSL